MLNGITVDVRLAVRRLSASPLFTIFAVLSLAAGIAVTTAVYSIVDSIFLNDDRGIRDPHGVAFVVDARDGRSERSLLTQRDFESLHEAQHSFGRISASTPSLLTVSTPVSSEAVAAELIDRDYFSALGASPVIGRLIQPMDDEQGLRVAVISERFWRRRFGAGADVIGREVQISGEPFAVVGVARAPFEGVTIMLPGMGTQVWVPRAVAPGGSRQQTNSAMLVFGRLGPSVTQESASSEVASIAARLDLEAPIAVSEARGSGRPWRVRTFSALAKDETTLSKFGLTIVGLVGLVLIVACTNLANLVISRGVGRRQEFAVRAALGASRWRLVREQSVESVLIAVLGGIASYAAFKGLSRLLAADFHLSLPMGQHWTISIRPALNGEALAVAAGALLLALVVFGLEPALALTRRTSLTRELASAGGSIGDLKAPRQRALLRWQVAIAAGFFIIATMFVKFTFQEARHDPGIALDRMAVATLNPGVPGWTDERRQLGVERVLDAARSTPGGIVAASAGFPFGTVDPLWLTVRVPGAPRRAVRTTAMAATPEIFRALDVPLLRGRGFDDRDHATAPAVAVISEFTERQLFQGADGLGRQIVVQGGRRGTVTTTVVGIARNTDVRRMFGDPAPFLYLPLSQSREIASTIVSRASNMTGTTASLSTLMTVIRSAEPGLPIDALGTGRSVLAGPFQLLRSAGLASLGLGVLTLFLAMVGLFGIESHIVSRRTREIGVRMAFGASPRQIQRMVLKDGYRPVLEGLAIGLFIGLTGRAIVRAYLELDISIVDPWMLFLVPIPLVLAACCACYLPARRASAIDPTVALRHL